MAAKSVSLVKVGDLAKSAGVLPSTVRFYVKEGLLEPHSHTRGGFLLFDPDSALKRLRQIRRYQIVERLTLSEIRERLRTIGA